MPRPDPCGTVIRPSVVGVATQTQRRDEIDQRVGGQAGTAPAERLGPTHHAVVGGLLDQ